MNCIAQRDPRRELFNTLKKVNTCVCRRSVDTKALILSYPIQWVVKSDLLKKNECIYHSSAK